MEEKENEEAEEKEEEDEVQVKVMRVLSCSHLNCGFIPLSFIMMSLNYNIIDICE